MAQNIKQDLKSFYAYARNKTKCKVQVGPLTTQDDNTVSSAAEMVNAFNDYFISLFTKEDTSRLPAPVTLTNIKCSDVNFTISDVYDKLAKLHPDKVAGPDNLMSPRFLLQIKDYVTYPLYLLFRKSLDEDCIVPTDWKNANISPIHKKGSRNKAENYRPISLTSQICELFESIIKRHCCEAP